MPVIGSSAAHRPSRTRACCRRSETGYVEGRNVANADEVIECSLLLRRIRQLLALLAHSPIDGMSAAGGEADITALDASSRFDRCC